MPRDNRKDLVEIPQEVRDELEFVPVATVHEAIDKALEPQRKPPAKKPAPARKAKRRK